MGLNFTSQLEKIESPKVFISYAWGTDEYQKRVLRFAIRMVRDGIDVVLDKWNLMEGNNSFAFMEHCINDESVSNVLILIDPLYSKKANGKEGGVGTETLIISPEIYKHADQSKFLPILKKKDIDGNILIPNYLNGVIYYDFSEEDSFGKEYRRLIKRLYGVASYKKPDIGKKPDWVVDSNGLEDDFNKEKSKNTQENDKTDRGMHEKVVIEQCAYSFPSDEWLLNHMHEFEEFFSACLEKIGLNREEFEINHLYLLDVFVKVDMKDHEYKFFHLDSSLSLASEIAVEAYWITRLSPIRFKRLDDEISFSMAYKYSINSCIAGLLMIAFLVDVDEKYDDYFTAERINTLICHLHYEDINEDELILYMETLSQKII